jgi:hypothetical protein
MVIFKKINYPFGIKYCNYFLKKNGKLNYYDKFYRFNSLWCLINDKICFDDISYINIFNYKNNDKIISILLILLYIQNKNLFYLKNSPNTIILFKKNNYIKIKILKYLLIEYKKTNNLNYLFVYYRILYSKDIKNSSIFTRIFYDHFITKEKLEELKINKNNISNYHELYLILKKKKIVDYYYKKIVPDMIKIYKSRYNIYEDYLNYYKKIDVIKKSVKIKKFKDVNIFKLIDKYVKSKSDRKYIKDNLIILSKKYHIKIE